MTRRSEILIELEELNSKERAEFAKHDLLAVLLKKPNQGFEATTWIRDARGPLKRELNALDGRKNG